MLALANRKLASWSDALFTGLGRALGLLRPAARGLAGSWQPPGWLRIVWALALFVLRWLQQRLAGVAALVLLALAGWAGSPQVLKWWHGLTPERVEPTIAIANAERPGRTRIEDDREPNPFVIHFSASAAPVERVGKDAAGVTIEPAVAGRWTWSDGQTLAFMPAQDWPVGQPYKVRVGKNALAPHVELAQREFEFVSPEFAANIESAEFYQDPVQANVRRAVFRVRFSHPVNTAEFEKRVTLNFDQACSGSIFSKCASEKFTVSYDKLHLVATLQSEPLAIPEKTRPVVFSLAAGAVAQRGGPGLDKDMRRSVDIPGLYNLAIQSVDEDAVTGENGEPEHVLHVTASMPVHEREMARVVQAWLLPAAKQAKDDADEKFDWSANPGDVTDAVLRRARKLDLQPIASEREVTEMVSFRMPQAEGGRYLLVRVAKGLKTPGGYQLGEALQSVQLLKPFAPELAIMSRGSLLALSGERKLPILVRDLPGIRVEIGRLLPRQLQHLITQAGGEFTKFGQPEFYRGIQPDDLMERFSKDIPIDALPGKAHYETVDFADYLLKNANDRRGVFLLRVKGYDPKAEAKSKGESADQSARDEASASEEGGDGENGDGDEGEEGRGDPGRHSDQRLVLVTDLGIVAKKSLDGTRDVFVQSIANGQPVAGAQVEVWGRNGTVVAAQATDATGAAKLPSLAGFQREKQPVALVVRKEGDLSFLPLDRVDRALDVSRFDVGGLRAAGVPNQMTGYLFSDRGIYRPGDTMHIGMIVKAGNWATSLRDLPLEAEIIDARGLSVRREKLRLGPAGAAEIEHTTQDSSPTGNYTVSLYLPRESSPGNPEVHGLLIGSATVKVQEFLPDRTKVTARLSSEAAEGWVKPNDLKALIDVQNLFGTPAPNRKVEGTLTLSPAFPAFRAFADYAFFDPQRATDKQEDDLGSVQTSDEGKAEFDLRLSRFQAATYQVQVFAKAFEPEGGRSVAAEAHALVSDRPYLVGVKVDGDASYVSKGAARNVSVIAIDPQAKKTAVAGLKIERVERKVLSVLVKQDSGLYRYESRRKEVVLESKPFAIAAAGSAVALDTATPGDFAYVIRDAGALELNRVEYSVAGNANVSRSLDRNAELHLTLDRKDYEPGQEIQVSIRAPYVGAGLITIERDKVYAHAWFKTDQTASVQKITLPQDFEGTGYISVHFVRDPASDEIYMSPLSYGVAPFATSLARRTAKLQLTSSELVKPGETVKMKLTSDKPTRAVVFAVDEGILQVARYKTPDPLKHFFQKRALEVGTLQTLDLILPEFNKLMQGAAPGGDGEGDLGRRLNPFKRKRDKPVAYWSGLVEVNGSREFEYTVPDSFNGSLRVMAVAVNDDTAGAQSTRTVVRGDMVILPNAPLAMAPGDTVEVGVGLANNIEGSGKDAPIALTLTASGGLEVAGDATQTLKVNERGEASAKFSVRAKPGAQAVLGSSALVFTATHGEHSARLTNEVSVRPASPFVTLVQAGSFQRAGELSSKGDFYPNFRRSDLAVSAAPWAFATSMMQYLEAYPHGCTEQITSQTFPAVLLSNRPELVKEMARGRSAGQGPMPEARKTFERYLVQLRPRQTADGGFAMWPGDGSASPFATLYAVHLLVEARDRKLPVPQDLLQKANVYLQGWLGGGDNSLDNWRQRAQAAYLLTRQGIVVPAALANLREAWRGQRTHGWGDDLGAAYLAASYQLVKQEQVAGELIDPVWADLLARSEKKTRRNVWGSYYDPLVHDAMLLHLVARHFPARLKAIKPAVWEGMGAMVRDGWYNSLSSATMLLSVDAYFEAVAQNADGKLTAQAIDAKGQAAALALGAVNPITRAAVPPGTAKLHLANDSDFNLYYSWTEQGFERNLPATPVSQGLEISHEVLDAKGNPITQAKLGDEVTVRVRVRSLERASIDDVALVDVLPGGLEPVLQAASDASDDGDDADAPIWKKRLGGKGSWQVNYADIREDRVVFYGSVNRDLLEVTYKARATNAGDYVAPAAYGEAMYDRRIFARSGGARFQVVAQ